MLCDHTHGDWCPLALAVSGTPVEPGKKTAHESQSITEQCSLRMCGHRAHNLLVNLRSPRFSLTLGPRSSCGHKSVLAICVQAKGRQHNLSQNIRPVIGGSVRPALPGLLERNECIKEIVPLKLFKVQSSIFKVYGTRRAALPAPAALLPTALKSSSHHTV